MSARTARFLLIIALLAYWAISLNRLDALPTVREDEPWQTAPGYSFWTRGVYGSELFADFAHMDQRYYLFQPAFSLLLGLTARLWGLGLFQIRVVSVALGALTMCLTFRVGTHLGGRTVGVFAVYLFLLWRWWISTTVRASGVPLLDESRIARYDTLVPVFGLAAYYLFLVGQRTYRARDFFLAGAGVGLAGLAHVYGLFWLPVFALILFWNAGLKIFHARPLYWIALGAVVTWLPWLLYIASDWQDFIAQTSNYADRFDLLNPGFYLSNLVREPQRYGLSFRAIPSAVFQPGVWLLVLGMPIAWLWLWRQALSVQTLRTLIVSALFFPIAYGLLLKVKIPGYLLNVLPLFMLVIAYSAMQAWQTQRRAIRGLLCAAMLLLAADSAIGIINQQRAALEATPYHAFMARVRTIVPRSGRVMALEQYWLGLAENDVRGYGDVFFLTNPAYTPHPLTIDQALELVAPDIFVVDTILSDVIERGEDPIRSDANTREFALRYRLYMERHHARELGRISDESYGTLIVYAVSP